MEKHILVVFPHPDDEAFSSSGFITLNTRAGVPVTYACATLGEMGRNMGKNLIANRETLPMVRKQEMKEACEIMGIEDLRMLGFRDKTLEFENPELLTNVIYEILEEIKPSLLLTFYPGHGVHPDHDACGEAAVRAVARMKKEDRPVIYTKAITKNREDVLGKADIQIDVSDVIDVKIAAIRAHRTQTENMLANLKEKIETKDPEIVRWLHNEEFWIYHLED